MNNTCSTCKYWGDGSRINPNKHNACQKIEVNEVDGIPSKDAAYVDLFVADDTSLNVNFMTLANFGCTLHTPKI